MKKLVFMILTITVMMLSNLTSYNAHAEGGACITCTELQCVGGDRVCATATCRGNSYTCYTGSEDIGAEYPNDNQAN